METYDMKVNYLTKNQIDYELQIRGIKTTKKDLTVKRKMLKKLLDKEQASKKTFVDPEFNFDIEKVEINSIIDNIRTLIDEFEGPETDSAFVRIKTNIIHLIHRVERVETENEDVELAEYIVNFKNEAKATCLELEALFSEKVVLPSAAEFSPVNMNSTNLQNATFFNNHVLPATSKSVPVYKWDLKYNGEKSSSLKAFLERVDELCASRNVTKSDLITSACDLFSGNALIWFRSIKNKVSDWDSLVDLLLTEYLPPDYDDLLWTEIRERTQGRNESITIYVAIMETLFSRLGKIVPEVTKLKYIKKRILPHYASQLALKDINSISDLIKYCKKLDEAHSAKIGYKPPPSHCSLEPELAFVDRSEPPIERKVYSKTNKSKTYFNRNNKVNTNHRQEVSVVNQDMPSTSRVYKQPLICYNCNLANHSFRNCRAPRKTFCFKCGKQNETIKTCPCSKNGQ